MRPGQLDLLDLPMPLTLHPRAPVSDEDLMRFSAHNKPYKVERNKEGDLTIMTPVGGVGSTQENYVAARLYLWADQRQNGVSFNANGCGLGCARPLELADAHPADGLSTSLPGLRDRNSFQDRSSPYGRSENAGLARQRRSPRLAHRPHRSHRYGLSSWPRTPDAHPP